MMRAVRHALIIVVLLAASALAAAPAHAAWSAPQTVSSGANEAALGTLDVSPQDRALVTWMPMRWENRHFVDAGQRAATRAPGAAAFDAERRVAAFLAGPVLFGTTRAVGLGGTVGSWNRCGPRVDLQVRYGRSDGTFPAPAPTIAAFRATGGNWGPAVDANAAGQVAVAWVQSTSDCKRAIVRFAHRRGGGTGAFTPAETLRGRGSNERPSVAVGQGGDMLVAWARRTGEGLTTIEARYRAAGGGWGAVQRLGQGTVAGRILAGVTQNGRAYVIWQRSSISESTGLTASLFAAVQPAGVRTFRAATRLDGFRVPTVYLSLQPALAVAGNRALVGWTGRDGGHWRVWAADSGSSGAFGARQWLSDADRDALMGDVALLPGGTAAAAWSHGDDEMLPADVMASVRLSAGAFGAPEQVTAGQPRALPLTALSLTTLRPTVAWTENLGPPSNSAAKLDVRVRASERD
jgi:hypothetical protein